MLNTVYECESCENVPHGVVNNAMVEEEFRLAVDEGRPFGPDKVSAKVQGTLHSWKESHLGA